VINGAAKKGGGWMERKGNRRRMNEGEGEPV